jgi:hypothetical protein
VLLILKKVLRNLIYILIEGGRVVEFLFSRDGIYAYAGPDEAQQDKKHFLWPQYTGCISSAFRGIIIRALHSSNAPELYSGRSHIF